MKCIEEHPGQSCLGGSPHQGWTLLFPRKLSDEEWSIFSARMDEAWYSSIVQYPGQPQIHDWNPLKLGDIAVELFGEDSKPIITSPHRTDTHMKPTIGRIVWYRTDGRNGISYDVPAIITCTAESHAGDYPDGTPNTLPVPGENEVHLTVFSPGEETGFYTELNVPMHVQNDIEPDVIANRSWRWPVIEK